jgi:hypothetical protein
MDKETKVCKKCGDEKSLFEFPITRSYTGKAKYRRHICKECYRKEARRRYHARKVQF